MEKGLKTKFQKIHYAKEKPGFLLGAALSFGEIFYKSVINLKNSFYEYGILKEKKVDAEVICVGNLTTGGVGKTPIVIELANELSKDKKVAIISRGYGSKLSSKKVNVIKDNSGVKFENGLLCGDEPFQVASKTNKNVVVITCADRKKASEFAIEKYGVQVVILDDGFSNRKIKKDRTILVIDSKMRFGNGFLLPKGPLREPIEQIKRASEIFLVDKGDKDFSLALEWVKQYNKSVKTCKMVPNRIYNLQTKADVKIKKQKALAFCAIGQPEQFFDFAKEYYDITPFVFEDHHKYTKNDIKKLILKAKKENVSVFITTQKDETKIKPLVENVSGFSFNVLELKTRID